MKFIRNIAVMAAFSLQVAAACAQTWPTRTITLVVPAGAGGVLDSTARTVAQKLNESLGQSVVVENRTGASGEIGAAQVARSTPDGYTLLVAIANPLGKLLGRGLYTDLQPIGLVADGGQLALAVPAGLPARNGKELVDLMRADASKANYLSSGVGFPAHITAELFKREGKFDAQHIPMKGGGQNYAELISGRVSFAFLPAVIMPGHVQAARLRALAVPSKKRSPVLPEVPTMAELGFPTATVPDFWIGVFAPKNMPKVVIERISAALQGMSGNEEFRGTLAKLGFVPSTLQLDAVTDRVRQDAEYWIGTASALKINAPE